MEIPDETIRGYLADFAVTLVGNVQVAVRVYRQARDEPYRGLVRRSTVPSSTNNCIAGHSADDPVRRNLAYSVILTVSDVEIFRGVNGNATRRV